VVRRQHGTPSTAERQGFTAARLPSPREAAWLVVRPAPALDAAQRRFVTAPREQSPSIAKAADLVCRFVQLLRDRKATALSEWMAQARASGLRGFTDGIARDRAAVEAAVSQAWSNGQVEGHVHRLKAITRQMDGRAGFELLRRRLRRAP
jgi:transposase